jgi:hypothetical protein
MYIYINQIYVPVGGNDDEKSSICLIICNSEYGNTIGILVASSHVLPVLTVLDLESKMVKARSYIVEGGLPIYTYVSINKCTYKSMR